MDTFSKQSFGDSDSMKLLDAWQDTDILKCISSDDSVINSLRMMMFHLKKSIEIMRMKPTKKPGDEGYQAELEKDADRLQYHADQWWHFASKHVGEKVLTSYGHSLKCGNFSRFMKKWGFLVVFYIRVPPIGQLNELTKSTNLVSNRVFELALPS